MTTVQTAAATASSRPAVTRAALTCGIVAGPLWAVVSLTQAATREGFNLARLPLSVLSNGSLGWLQITNFVLAGLLLLVGSVGLGRAMTGTPGGTWAPRLLAVAGLGNIAAGALRMDPVSGFPVGTPPTSATTMSWHSAAHMGAGSITFITLTAACYVLGYHFRRTGHRRLALGSRAAGTVLSLGFGWSMTGGPAGSLTLAIGFITAMVWIAVVTSAYHAHTSQPASTDRARTEGRH